MKQSHLVAAAAVLLGGGFLWLWMAANGQRPRGTDTAQIRSMIARGARAAQRRDSATINRMISGNYTDGNGFRAEQLRAFVAKTLRESGSAQVYIPDESVSIQVEPGGKEAHASFHVRFQGAEGQFSGTPFDGTLTIRLKKEPVRYYWIFSGEEWRVMATEGYLPDALLF